MEDIFGQSEQYGDNGKSAVETDQQFDDMLSRVDIKNLGIDESSITQNSPEWNTLAATRVVSLSNMSESSQSFLHMDTYQNNLTDTADTYINCNKSYRLLMLVHDANPQVQNDLQQLSQLTGITIDKSSPQTFFSAVAVLLGQLGYDLKVDRISAESLGLVQNTFASDKDLLSALGVFQSVNNLQKDMILGPKTLHMLVQQPQSPLRYDKVIDYQIQAAEGQKDAYMHKEIVEDIDQLDRLQADIILDTVDAEERVGKMPRMKQVESKSGAIRDELLQGDIQRAYLDNTTLGQYDFAQLNKSEMDYLIDQANTMDTLYMSIYASAISDELLDSLSRYHDLSTITINGITHLDSMQATRFVDWVAGLGAVDEQVKVSLDADSIDAEAMSILGELAGVDYQLTLICDQFNDIESLMSTLDTIGSIKNTAKQEKTKKSQIENSLSDGTIVEGLTLFVNRGKAVMRPQNPQNRASETSILNEQLIQEKYTNLSLQVGANGMDFLGAFDTVRNLQQRAHQQLQLQTKPFQFKENKEINWKKKTAQKILLALQDAGLE